MWTTSGSKLLQIRLGGDADPGGDRQRCSQRRGRLLCHLVVAGPDDLNVDAGALQCCRLGQDHDVLTARDAPRVKVVDEGDAHD